MKTRSQAQNFNLNENKWREELLNLFSKNPQSVDLFLGLQRWKTKIEHWKDKRKDRHSEKRKSRANRLRKHEIPPFLDEKKCWRRKIFSDKRRDWEREKQETKRDTRSRKGKFSKGPEINKISLWLFGPLVFYFPTPSISPPFLSLSYIVLGLCFCLPSWKVNFFHQPQDETTIGSTRLSLLPFLSIPPSLSLPPSPSSLY